MIFNSNKKPSLVEARFKLVIAILLILFVVSTASGKYFILALYFFITVILLIIFKPKPLFFLKRAFIVFLFPLSIAVFIPFANPGKVIYEIDLSFFTITVTDMGLEIFFTTLIKSFLSVLIMTALVTSTNDTELLHGLRKIYFPKIIVSIIFLMYRYLFLIRDEAKVGQLAINSRVFQRSYRTVNKRLAFLAGNLFIKAFDRAENIYKSMESRGYDGNFYYVSDSAMSNRKSLIIGITIISIMVLILAGIKYLEITGLALFN